MKSGKVEWYNNNYRNIERKKAIGLTIICVIIVYGYFIYSSLKHPSPIDIYYFIGMTLFILIYLPIGYYYINKYMNKECPKEVGFSKDGIHFKYIDRENVRSGGIINVNKS